MPKNPDQAFRQLLKILLDEQRVKWEQVSSHNRRQQREKVISRLSRYLVTDQHQLYLKQHIDLVRDSKLIPLPPLRRDAHLIPFLTLVYHGDGREDTCCRIYVLLLEWDGGGIRGIGFRMESPEKNCEQGQQDEDSAEIGSHDFYHAQFIKSVKNWKTLYRTPDWLPVSQPSFPLWAVRPVDALLNLVLTLYGAKYYLEFWKEHSRKFASAISEEFKALDRKLTKGNDE